MGGGQRSAKMYSNGANGNVSNSTAALSDAVLSQYFLGRGTTVPTTTTMVKLKLVTM